MTSQAFGYQTRGAAAVIALPERAEAGTVFALRSRSERALEAGHRWIAVDLRAVNSVDTHTLGERCVTLRRISGHGRRLAIVGADPRVQWVLELCDIDGLDLHPTLKSALARSALGGRSRPRWRGRLARRRLSPKRASVRS